MTQIYLKKIDEVDLPTLWHKMSDTSSEWQKMNDPLNEQPIPTKAMFFSEIACYWVNEGNPLLIMLGSEMIGVVSWSDELPSSCQEQEKLVLDIGLIIFERQARGKGYGTEALLLVIDYLFILCSYLDAVTITTWSGNERMIAVAEKLKLPLYNAKTKKLKLDDVLYDQVVYRVNRELWEENANED